MKARINFHFLNIRLIYYAAKTSIQNKCEGKILCPRSFYIACLNDPHNMNSWWRNVWDFILTFCTCITAWTRDIRLRWRYTPHAMRLGKQTCSNLESIPLMLFSDWTSPTSCWVECRPPDLVSHLASPLWISTICLASTWNQSSACSLLTMEDLSHQKAGQLTLIWHPACHCLPNYPLALSIWQTIYNELLDLVLKPL